MTSLTHSILSIEIRTLFAKRIVRRLEGYGYTHTVEDFLPQQYYARYLNHGHLESGVATRLYNEQGAYVWLFQSVEQPTPGRVASSRLELCGHCATVEGN